MRRALISVLSSLPSLKLQRMRAGLLKIAALSLIGGNKRTRRR
jgi:hypothetical protein